MPRAVIRIHTATIGPIVAPRARYRRSHRPPRFTLFTDGRQRARALKGIRVLVEALVGLSIGGAWVVVARDGSADDFAVGTGVTGEKIE